MFPEDDLRLDFWQFVVGRADDARTDYELGPSLVLNGLELHRGVARQDVEGITNREASFNELEFQTDIGVVIGYTSIQDALLAYLIHRLSTASSGTISSRIDGFPYDYATWLRTVVLVMTDAAREPDRLTLHIPVNEEGRYDPESSRVHEHTMRLDGSWDCLSRDTFAMIKRHFQKTG